MWYNDNNKREEKNSWQEMLYPQSWIAEGEAIGTKKTEEAKISKLKAYGMTDEQIKAALS